MCTCVASCILTIILFCLVTFSKTKMVLVAAYQSVVVMFDNALLSIASQILNIQ